MTSKLTQASADARQVEIFPVFPPRDDMQNFNYLYRPGYPSALHRRLGLDNSIVVLCEAPLRWTPGQRRGHRIPDLTVAFGADHELALYQQGYSIEDQGKPPDFVLEVASSSTGEVDYTDKRVDYANFGVTEYWRFDSSGGDYYDAPLAGDLLVDGQYQPIEIHRTDATHLWGHSDALNLTLCWEEGRLRLWDPVARRYLLTFDETDEERMAAEARANSAEARADSAEARVRELEAELEQRRQR